MPPQQGPYGAPPSYSPPPQQSFPPQAPNQSDPARYDFFMTPSKPSRGSLLSGSGGNFFKKIALIVGGVVLLMILVAVGLSFIPSNLNTEDLLGVAKSQNALYVTCADATSNAKLQDSKNFAASCMVGLMTAQQKLLEYTSARGLKISSKTLKLGVSAQDTSALKASITASTYDTTFASIAQRQLTQYTAHLKATFKDAKSPAQRKLISDDYTGAQLLLQQLNSISSAPTPTP